MDSIRSTLEEQRDPEPELRRLRRALGDHPERPPPSEAAVQRLREAVSLRLGLTPVEGDKHHPSSPWRYNLVAAVQCNL